MGKQLSEGEIILCFYLNQKVFLKIKYITTELGDLISRIKSDHKNRIKMEEPLSMNVLTVNGNIEQSTTGLNGQCVHSHIFIDLLLRMKYNQTDNNELISLCKETYKNNKSQLRIIQEFEDNYSSNKALWWYTRESFFFRMLNKALRVQNFDLLFLFRSFIRDIHQQLKHDQCERPIQVYRGQLMSNDELNTLKRSIGEYVSVNSFLSTSGVLKLALFYLGDTTASDDLERVLFVIDADPCNVTTASFADISKHSYFPIESEILFMIGSIFRLTEIRRGNDQYWIIQMALCGANEHGLCHLLEHMRRGYGSEEESTLLSFGSAMWRMGKFNEAEKYYRRLLKEFSSDDPSLGYLYHNLGIVTYDKGDYDTSLQCYQKSLDIRMRTRPSDYVNSGNTYNCIGNVYRKKGDHVQALQSYNQGVSLFKQAGDEEHPAIAHLYNNIGIVYQKQKEYFKALTSYEKSLAIQQV
jgi:tetratricopeptide (TPR) repeat protein